MQGQFAKADPFTDSVLDAIISSVGVRVKGINETTRDEIAKAIQQGFGQGLSPAEVAELIEDATTFDEARAELVARTESALVYNEAAVRSYRENGVEQVEVIDGDQDAICAAVNGATWTLAEAMENPLGHPNCQRDFVPLV